MSLLNQIQSPLDLKVLTPDQLHELSRETRDFAISTILENGGHFAGNLGVVELTLALHFVFDSPSDKLIWDVGHQAYIHKIFTGRKNNLHGIRSTHGISGFPKMSESIHDCFGTGHSSTAISAACGMAVAAKLKNEHQRKFIAIVGDGALTGGMSFEALNNLAASHANVLVVINDNHIGIDAQTGALDEHLQLIANSPSNYFQNLGLTYDGPFDGHDLDALIQIFKKEKNQNRPHVIHLRTVKGKGYPPAEQEQTRFHSTVKYVKINSTENNPERKWQDAFAEILEKLADNNPKICGITPAMPSGSGMIRVMEKYPNRFFDVGIAEQHAVTFAAGMAAEGLIPIVNIYSTFLQRGYDQLIHDVALQNLHVVFCIDRAGLVGEDGPTHHGSFDISYLLPIPGIVVSAPQDENEFIQLMNMSAHAGKPFCIRYPKGKINKGNDTVTITESQSVYQMLDGEEIAVLSTGIATGISKKAIEISQKKVALFHIPIIKPWNETELLHILKSFSKVITVEDGSIRGGMGEAIAALAARNNCHTQIINRGIPDDFVTHGDNAYLYDCCGYSPEKIANLILSLQRN